jgi:hypothetical protein
MSRGAADRGVCATKKAVTEVARNISILVFNNLRGIARTGARAGWNTRGVIQDGLIVKGERQEDFDALRQEWLEEYVPKGALEERLLEDIVRYKWFLMRAERNVEKVAARMAEREPEEWSEADHKLLQLMMRYQAARERTFYRAWHAFEQLRKDRGKQLQYTVLRQR